MRPASIRLACPLRRIHPLRGANRPAGRIVAGLTYGIGHATRLGLLLDRPAARIVGRDGLLQGIEGAPCRIRLIADRAGFRDRQLAIRIVRKTLRPGQ